MKKRLVISAVNLIEGGTLTAFRDCLTGAENILSQDWEIIALVHDKSLFNNRRVVFIEFPEVKRSWLKRLYYEFWYFKSLSKQLKPDVWFSMHDISAHVTANRRAVYCHNPSTFYRINLTDIWWEPKFFLFTLFYRYLYGLNIHANNLVVVQQNWLRNAFQSMYQLNNVVVAHPVIRHQNRQDTPDRSLPGVFFYPALPRVFKNFEVLYAAAKILREQIGNSFEIRLTLSGHESRYARHLLKRFADMPNIRFIGYQSQVQMFEQYQQASAIVFPSKLETWGLPISEAKNLGKQLIVADLPYAYEPVGTYHKVVFFEPDNAEQLAAIMLSHIQGRLENQQTATPSISPPYAQSWEELIMLVISDTV
ncbi:glycosyltransferase [Methylomonas paludis]|uniref:Glycosyltransferase n=1 Tax=Methylomonas paludis TaxID=1173101 RepID=A0A975MN62_9GAMM|nr:glycosyltransferase [Methylomonas paludis]QWF70936.1 glycosyltransferase [Methylomonas paludis]